MLNNTVANPEASMMSGQYGTSGIPGYGTSVNPSSLIPGLY
jgi:hypothetical protein